MAHTPGPWKVTEYDDGWIDGVLEYAGCGSHEADWVNPDDKLLVLAAPDLLEQLQVARQALVVSYKLLGLSGANMVEEAAFIQDIDAVIAKATAA